MKGAPATYKGRMISKEHFRVFIYSPDGTKKLIESWDEFEKHMETGLWFANRKDAEKPVEPKVEEEKPKRVRNKPVATTTLELKEEPLIEEELIPVGKEDLVFEVKDDGFLPKEKK